MLASAYDAEIDGIYYNLNSETNQAEVTYRSSSEKSYSGTIVIPSSVTIKEYIGLVGGMYKTIANNCFENESLVVLRDSLLPRLMSGELDVSKIEL